MTDARQTRSEKTRHRFFVAAAGLMLAITLIGFAPSFFLKIVFQHPGMIARIAEGVRDSGDIAAPGLPLHVVAHGVLATGWMSLFFAQTLLISSGRRDVHRKLGIGGLFVATGVFVTGVYALFLAIPRLITLGDPQDPSILIAEQLPAMSGDLGTFITFSFAVGGAAYFRRRPETHKRLMLLASMMLVPPGISRVWFNSGVENAMEFWGPLTEGALAFLIIGGRVADGRARSPGAHWRVRRWDHPLQRLGRRRHDGCRADLGAQLDAVTARALGAAEPLGVSAQ